MLGLLLAGQEVGKCVGDAVDACKFLLLADDVLFALTLAWFGSAVAAADGGCARYAGARCVLSEQSVDSVRHALDLFNIATVDLSILKNLAIRWRQEHLRIGIKRPRTRLQRAVEKGCEVGVYVQIGLGDFGETV